MQSGGGRNLTASFKMRQICPSTATGCRWVIPLDSVCGQQKPGRELPCSMVAQEKKP